MPSNPPDAGLDPRWSYVRAGAILELIAERIPEHDWARQLRNAGLDQNLPARIKRGDVAYMTVQRADRVITGLLGDPGLWQQVEELSEAYEAA